MNRLATAFLEQRQLGFRDPRSGNLRARLLQCTLHGAALGESLDAANSAECSSQSTYYTSS